MKKSLGIYRPTLRYGKPFIWQLELVCGNTPDTLEYQKRMGSNPSYYYAKGDPAYRAYPFSQVKSVIEPVMYPAAKESLERWRKNIGEEEATRICEESKAAGEMGHKALANWTQNKPLGVCSMNMMGYRQGLENKILPYLNKNNFDLSVEDKQGQTIPLSEVFVADFELGFIGRLDLVTSLKYFNNTRVLLELKGSRKRKTIEQMESHIIQAVAYWQTFNRIALAYPNQLEPLDGVAMAYMYPDGEGDLLPILGQELREYEQQWQQWLNCFYDLLKGAKVA